MINNAFQLPGSYINTLEGEKENKTNKQTDKQNGSQ